MTVFCTAPVRTAGLWCMAVGQRIRRSVPPPPAAMWRMVFDDDLLDLSLQGPLAVDYLETRHVPGIRDLKYFHHMQTTLFKKSVMISRTGYTGERGYEIFCKVRGCGSDLGHDPGRRRGYGHHSLRLHRAGSAPAPKVICCSIPYDNSEMYPFEDEALRRHAYGNWAWISPSAPARPVFAAPRNITGCKARSVSKIFGRAARQR